MGEKIGTDLSTGWKEVRAKEENARATARKWSTFTQQCKSEETHFLKICLKWQTRCAIKSVFFRTLFMTLVREFSGIHLKPLYLIYILLQGGNVVKDCNLSSRERERWIIEQINVRKLNRDCITACFKRPLISLKSRSRQLITDKNNLQGQTFALSLFYCLLGCT